MSDVSLARNLIIEIAGDCWNGKADMLHRVQDATIEYAKDHKKKPSFSLRRLRGFFHRESAHVRFHEMVELANVATYTKAQKEKLKNAKQAHAEFIASIASTVHALDASDADFHRQQIEALSALASGSSVSQVGNTASARDANTVFSSTKSRTDSAGDRK